MATKHYNLPTMPTGAVDWPAIINDIVAKVEVGRTVKLTAGETLAKGKAFYVKAADGKAYLATYSTGIAGLWQSSSTGAGVEGFGQIGGIMTDSSWTWTPGSYLYVDGSSNLTATDPGTGVRPVAYAISATEVILLESAGHAHDASDVVAGNLAIARMPLGGTWTYTSDVVMQPSSTTLNGLIVRAKTAMGSTTFTGTGLNDAAYGGTYSGTVNRTYRVEIDATGTPDTFRWSEDGGSTWKASGVSITGSAQALSYGVTVTFTNTTGHTVGDYWEVSVTAFSGSLGQWQDAGGTALVEFLSGGGAYFRRDVEGASEIICCENLAQASTSNTLKVPFRMQGGTGTFTFAELEVKASSVGAFAEAGELIMKVAKGGSLATALDIVYSSGNFLFGLGMTPAYALDVKGTDFRLDGGAASTTARIRLVDRDATNLATETIIRGGRLVGEWRVLDTSETTTWMAVANTNVIIGGTAGPAGSSKNLVLMNGADAEFGMADASCLFSKDIAGVAGKASLHFRNEVTGGLIVPGIVYKTTTGDPSYSFEGMMIINTADNTLKMYADGALRQIYAWSGSQPFPDGSVLASGAPGIVFQSYADSGLAANDQNLAIWESGIIAINISSSLREIRFPANFKFAFSSANDNNSASDTSVYRNAAGELRTAGSFTFDLGCRINTSTSKPTADATQRGKLWVTQGGTGVADTLEICLKSAAGTYSWVTVATG